MPVVRRSALAEQDYREIWRYIAADNPDAADRFSMPSSTYTQTIRAWARCVKH